MVSQDILQLRRSAESPEYVDKQYSRRRSGNSFNSKTVLITTADKGISRMMRNALTAAGYSREMINDDNIPPRLSSIWGLEKGERHVSDGREGCADGMSLKRPGLH